MIRSVSSRRLLTAATMAAGVRAWWHPGAERRIEPRDMRTGGS